MMFVNSTNRNFRRTPHALRLQPCVLADHQERIRKERVTVPALQRLQRPKAHGPEEQGSQVILR
jgi:hypothetical protein